MTISYNWLCDYLPEGEKPAPELLSTILTAIGLEVESMEKYERIKGSLQGVVIGEVLTCEQHPNADKLKLTTVNAGEEKPLQIVCGAPNVAAGQKVVVALVGTTLYPIGGEPLTIKAAKIRNVESFGMLCAEDELGIGESHAGIIVLPDEVKAGAPATTYFKPYSDYIFEIGITPNHSDALCHEGVARDVCAYLSHHHAKTIDYVKPADNFKIDNQNFPISVTVENTEACKRYAGVSVSGVTIAPSPEWLQNRLKAIGQRPINNVVDITNYVLHETGQPLHAFDADEIKGNKIIVKNLPEGAAFVTLDNTERKLSAQDLMICNSEEGMCIAGVFGGIKSGVGNSTKNIFLESAWFNPTDVRKTSVKHNLRTDAATRFEKGVDISNTVNALKRAASLIKEIAGGKISSEITDVYPVHAEKRQVILRYDYLKKLSGKYYTPEIVKRILLALKFDILNETETEITVAVPFHKPDISLPADLVEEIIRIDGLDNIEIPSSIQIMPMADELGLKEELKNKIAEWLAAQGFHEIVTNSITNSKYYDAATLAQSVKMLNSLSADLDILRPSMLETGLDALSFNINRKNSNLQFFEFGKTYHAETVGKYNEIEHLALFITGKNHEDQWNEKAREYDFYRAKGIAHSLLYLCGFKKINFNNITNNLVIEINKQKLGTIIEVDKECLKAFDIKVPVFFMDIDFMALLGLFEQSKILYKEIPKFPAVQRDLAMIVDKPVAYQSIETAVKK
ncbi:MAG: phenylalanine--tRNA ligase subunit beta, partial [Chitinophagaceae bacterium]|nr:phenylalanine--tRNA ligase subunit beta [Chitinophagaceae bacterium]